MSMPLNKHKPFVIGLVGGVAAGKSVVARALERMGAVVIDADHLGHQVLARHSIAQHMGQVFGEAILNVEGEVDRKRLAAIVFADSDESKQALEKLEKIVHPLIRAAAMEQLQNLLTSASQFAMVVIDAPLLLEANWAPMCDAILFVDCAAESRAERAAERGWSLAEFQSREAAQMPLELKKQQATHIISNDAGTQELERQLRRIVEKILAKH